EHAEPKHRVSGSIASGLFSNNTACLSFRDSILSGGHRPPGYLSLSGSGPDVGRPSASAPDGRRISCAITDRFSTNCGMAFVLIWSRGLDRPISTWASTVLGDLESTMTRSDR